MRISSDFLKHYLSKLKPVYPPVDLAPVWG